MSWFSSGLLYLLLCLFCAYGQVNTCECVPYYLCVNDTINTNGEQIIDIRIKEVDCDGYLEICCNTKDVLTEPNLRSPVIAKKRGCGYRNIDGVGFRIKGDENNEAQFGEFPWMVAILHQGEDDEKYVYKCGGSLIHPQVVLTAAHCIAGGQNFKVRAGEWDTRTTQEVFKHQEKEVTSAVIHREFKKHSLENDMALLFLESPLNTSQHVDVVCLPVADSVVLSDECFVSGWGKEKFEKAGEYQNILKRIELPVINREQCQRDFRKTRLGRLFKLHRSFMCAGGEEGHDACTGDGGGPLVCPVPGEENRYQQVGIVAWGIGCGTKGVPGAYADVAYFRNWVDQQMKKRKYSVSTYQF